MSNNDYDHLITTEDWDAEDWATVYEVITQADRGPVTPDRIVRVTNLHVDRSEGYASVNLALLADATNGWLTCTAWCDTTGWDCQSDGRWHWAPTREDAIRNGLDSRDRRVLGLELEG